MTQNRNAVIAGITCIFSAIVGLNAGADMGLLAACVSLAILVIANIDFY